MNLLLNLFSSFKGISYPDDYQLCCGINECCKAELNFILYPITDYK